MRLALVALAACGGAEQAVDSGSDANGVHRGTVAFAAAQSGSIQLVDVATRSVTTIDPGKHVTLVDGTGSHNLATALTFRSESGVDGPFIDVAP